MEGLYNISIIVVYTIMAVAFIHFNAILSTEYGEIVITEMYHEKRRNLKPPAGKSHYGDVIMGAIASQITSLTIVYSTVYSDADQRKHQSSASLAFVRGIHRGPVNSPHKWPVTRKMFPFDDAIMLLFKIIIIE